MYTLKEIIEYWVKNGYISHYSMGELSILLEDNKDGIINCNFKKTSSLTHCINHKSEEYIRLQEITDIISRHPIDSIKKKKVLLAEFRRLTEKGFEYILDNFDLEVIKNFFEVLLNCYCLISKESLALRDILKNIITDNKEKYPELYLEIML